MAKKIAVLGATGSIGTSTLDVIRSAGDDFEPVLLSAQTNTAALCALGREFPRAVLALSGENISADLPAGNSVIYGRAALLSAIKTCGADIVIHGIAGAAGLEPSLAALESGAHLALANKESVVMGWNLISETALRHNALIIPVDSEHSALFNLIRAHCPGARPSEIILTASGGPFRTLSPQELAEVTVERALSHPTWNMGAKITIDSATLANKGLEVIEAARLFDMPPEHIRVTVHPQSIVHSMIRLPSGAVYGEFSRPDMRLPIHNALYYPESRPCPFAHLEFTAPAAAPLTLSFEEPDTMRFPMLSLAYAALRSGGLYSVAYNAANEAAVARFSAGGLRFPQIAQVTEAVLAHDWSGSPQNLDAIFDADRRARDLAAHIE